LLYPEVRRRLQIEWLNQVEASFDKTNLLQIWDSHQETGLPNQPLQVSNRQQ
jgi:hypothetical protein